MNVFSKKRSWIVWSFEGFDLFPRLLWEDRYHFHICQLNMRLQPKWWVRVEGASLALLKVKNNPPTNIFKAHFLTFNILYNPYYGEGMNRPPCPFSDWHLTSLLMPEPNEPNQLNYKLLFIDFVYRVYKVKLMKSLSLFFYRDSLNHCVHSGFFLITLGRSNTVQQVLSQEPAAQPPLFKRLQFWVA